MSESPPAPMTQYVQATATVPAERLAEFYGVVAEWLGSDDAQRRTRAVPPPPLDVSPPLPDPLPPAPEDAPAPGRAHIRGS